VLERLDIPTLVHRAQVYMDSGHPNQAMPFIRTAVRRAPLRRDLRRLLVMAVEAGVDVGETELSSGGLRAGADWQAQYGAAQTGGSGNAELRHTFMRPRAHASSSKPVFLTIAIVTGGVLVLMLGWAILRGSGPGFPRAGSNPAAMGGAEMAVAESEDPNAWILLEIQEYESAKKYAEGIERADDITDPSLRGATLARLFAAQAAAFEKAGRLASAQTAYENAIAYDADNTRLLKSLSGVLYERGRHQQPTDRAAALRHYEAADQWLRRSLVVAPSDTGALLLLARIEIARDDDAGAAELLRQVVSLDPESSDAERARQILTQRNLRL
jgi:tetratricopeptide (TPR) repeat protein